MALNRQSILAEYQAIQKEVEKKQREMIGIESPETYRALLERGLLEREIAPGIAREEREVLKRMFAAPAAIRERLGPEVSPLEAEKLIGQRQANWIDQLQGLKDLRESKEDELKDIIASAALGYRAEVEARRASLQALKDQATAKWREYQQAYREYSDNVMANLYQYYGPKQEEAMKKFINETTEWFREKEGDDGYNNPNDWLGKLEEFIEQFGVQNVSNFYKAFSPKKYVNPDDFDILQDSKYFRIEDLSKTEAQAFDPYYGMSLTEKKNQVAIDVISWLAMGESPEALWTYAVSHGVIPDSLAPATSPEYKIYKAFLQSEAGKQFLNERK